MKTGNIRAWMRTHARAFVDPLTGELDPTALVEAWDRDCAGGSAALDSNHPAWIVASHIADEYNAKQLKNKE
jgi:hypothetical protein